jgi:hypothetical protein
VQPLLLDPPEGAITTVLELEKLGPIDGKDGSLEFFSAAVPIDLVEQTTTGLKPGTLGMSVFGVSDRATRSKTLHERTFATCAYTQQDGDNDITPSPLHESPEQMPILRWDQSSKILHSYQRGSRP